MKILLPSQSCAVFSKLPFHVALLQVLQTETIHHAAENIVLHLLCYLHTLSYVKDYKSQDFLSKIVSSIISDTMLLVLDGNICFFQDMDRWCVVCFIKCKVRIAYTRNLVYSRKLISIGQG